MEILYTAVKTFAAIFVMTLIIPLMVWAGSGSFRAAMRALREYWLIMGTLAAVVGVAALWAVVMERIG